MLLIIIVNCYSMMVTHQNITSICKSIYSKSMCKIKEQKIRVMRKM